MIAQFPFSSSHSQPHSHTSSLILHLSSDIHSSSSLSFFPSLSCTRFSPLSLAPPFSPSSSSSFFFPPRINLYYLPLPSLLQRPGGREGKRGSSFFSQPTMAGFLIFLRHGLELQSRGVLASSASRGFTRMRAFGILMF